jgi:hypothetical protein
MRRAKLAVILLVAVSLAGCSTLPEWSPGPDGPEESGPSEEELAPGLTTSGVTDAEQLAFVHETQLPGTSYTYVSTW